MNQRPKQEVSDARWQVPIAACLAVFAGSVSLAIAVCASWQRGATEVDRWLIAGVNLIAVLAAQLLPALGQRLSLAKKCVCAGLWLTCVAFTVQGQAGFLLAAQERSGQARADAVAAGDTEQSKAGRDLPTILADKARLTEQFARAVPWPCVDACAARTQPKRAALDDRLKALDAEAQAAQDRHRQRMQLEDQMRQAHADVAGTHLAAGLGLRYEVATGITALTFALILEGVGCLCWSLVLTAGASASAGCLAQEEVVADGSMREESHPGLPISQEDCTAEASDSAHDYANPARSLADDVVLVVQAVRDLKIALTVAGVRDFLRCSQRWASQVRREADGQLRLVVVPDRSGASVA